MAIEIAIILAMQCAISVRVAIRVLHAICHAIVLLLVGIDESTSRSTGRSIAKSSVTSFNVDRVRGSCGVYRSEARQIEEPERHGKNETADLIAKEGRDHRFPNVVAGADAWCFVHDSERNEVPEIAVSYHPSREA